MRYSHYNFRDLLSEAGAIAPRGGRGKWTCPECGRTALSVDEDKELFHCFYPGCTFKGGMGTLRKRLGLDRQWLPREEFRRQQLQRVRADGAAKRFYPARKAHWSDTIDFLHTLNALEDSAHKLGPDDPRTWDGLCTVYESRPQTLARLLLLEISSIQGLIEYLGLDAKERKTIIARVILNGGICDSEGAFIELII